MKTIIIVDGNNNFYRAYFANMNLSFGDKNIGAIFQFPRIISSLKKKYNPELIQICWDGRSSEHRTKLLPQYRVRDKSKMNLRFDLEDFLYQKKYTMRMMYYLGIPQLHNKEIEADDYIYSLVKKYKAKGYRIIIVSTDKDFNQLIDEQCAIHSEKLGKLIHHKNALKTLGYEPSQTVDYLSILGDDSDKIPGVRGMGEVKTKQFLAKYKSIKKYLRGDENFGKLDRQELKRIYLLNRELIDLKIFHNKYLKDIPITYYKDKKAPRPNIDKHKELCIKFGIRELRKPEFTQLFKKHGDAEGSYSDSL